MKRTNTFDAVPQSDADEELFQRLLAASAALWNDSYCLISTGQVSLDVLKQYVENQRD